MSTIVVSGAYGRSYKSKAAALADWNDDKDFTIRTVGIRGTYINKPDAKMFTVLIRYNEDRSITPTN